MICQREMWLTPSAHRSLSRRRPRPYITQRSCIEATPVDSRNLARSNCLPFRATLVSFFGPQCGCKQCTHYCIQLYAACSPANIRLRLPIPNSGGHCMEVLHYFEHNEIFSSRERLGGRCGALSASCLVLTRRPCFTAHSRCYQKYQLPHRRTGNYW